MTILVTGGTGQLATALAAAGGSLVHRVGRPAFDFDHPETVEAAFRAASPSLVVNAAAYTGVDATETDSEAAFRANRDGPAQLARLCTEAAIPLIHISTDYVFDGLKGAPYVEDDPTSPQGVYGASKLAGEVAVLNSCPRAIVLRTSWVYSATGKNFVRTMLGAARRTPTLRVVADQKGCPTNAADLANAILAITARLGAQGWDDRFTGVFHAAGSGWTTWHGLAGAIFAEAAHHGMAPPVIEAIATADWPTPARRPPDSRLDCTRMARVFGVRLPDWRGSLSGTVGAILAAPELRRSASLATGLPGSILACWQPVGSQSTREAEMPVASVSKITAASPTSFDAAIQEGLARASKTLRGITGLHVIEEKASVANGKIAEYRVTMELTFILEG